MKLLALLCAAACAAPAADLSAKTIAEFARYMEQADRSMLARATSAQPRLSPAAGAPPQIVAWDKQNPRDVSDGLIHDWMGAMLIPGAKIADGVAVLKDISRYSQVYKGDIMRAKLIKDDGDRRSVEFRVVRKKVITVVLDIVYDVEFKSFNGSRTQVWSKSARISEVDNAGQPNEVVKQPGTGFGVLWQLNSYWHLEERDGGLLMECRAISLTRDIPTGLAWIVKPMITSLPEEALRGTMEKTRSAVLAVKK
ncbi:MAG: hypothetical protein HY821_14550 [Acidobacteria bacterium]|nr:hypothetical protein [Acidobacteriota bacterium]